MQASNERDEHETCIATNNMIKLNVSFVDKEVVGKDYNYSYR